MDRRRDLFPDFMGLRLILLAVRTLDQELGRVQAESINAYRCPVVKDGLDLLGTRRGFANLDRPYLM